MPRPFAGRAWTVILMFAAMVLATPSDAARVEFVFPVPPREVNPYAREVSATVVQPGGGRVRLPAFFHGDGRWAVRLRAERPGRYVLESADELEVRVPGVEAGPYGEVPAGVRVAGVVAIDVGGGREAVEVASVDGLAFVRRDPQKPDRFRDARGGAYWPMGMNLAWPPGADIGFYRDVLPRMRELGLNWTRVWMCHWSAMNLDWVEPGRGVPAPPDGELSPEVARRWDELLELLEENGVRVQVVLQHHGQWSRDVNSNWEVNPWNRANGGFLDRPGDFFRDAEALERTRRKYRTVVARYGWSPAVLSWELFNEVHFTDPIRHEGDVASVAAWHASMAAWLRAHDVHRHLVTTSTDDLASPVYAAMDYLQPHSYAADILADLRRVHGVADGERRPVFHGEFGDDNLVIDPAARAAGVTLVVPVWASLMGGATHAAQPWYGERILKDGRLAELGAVVAFARAADLAERPRLEVFLPTVWGGPAMRLEVKGAAWWVREPDPEVSLPLDGRSPAELASVPKAIVGPPAEGEAPSGFPRGFTLDLGGVARPLRGVIEARQPGRMATGLRLVADGVEVASVEVPGAPAATEGEEPPPWEPRELRAEFVVPAGVRKVRVENPRGPGWVDFGRLVFDLEVPAVAAAGKRDERGAIAWVWDRAGLPAAAPARVEGAVLDLGEVAAGVWVLAFVEPATGREVSMEVRRHGGGRLAVTVPPFERHLAFRLLKP